jgi:hypothetical protein
MSSPRTTDTAADEEQAAGAKTEDADADDAAEETGEATETEPEAGRDSDETAATTEATTDDAAEDVAGEPPETARSGLSSVAAGAAAVVSAGLGLASLTGTWLGDLMSSRQELIGQINGQTATPPEQVAKIYGTPWHTIALFNGFFALAAILVAGAALVVPAISKNGKNGEESPTWVRAVAVGGLVLGTIGLVIAALMWFDVFTDLPAVPEAPAVPG